MSIETCNSAIRNDTCGTSLRLPSLPFVVHHGGAKTCKLSTALGTIAVTCLEGYFCEVGTLQSKILEVNKQGVRHRQIFGRASLT